MHSCTEDGIFEDPDFPLNKSVLNVKKLGPYSPEPEWVRVLDFANRLQKSPILVPDAPIEKSDVHQGDMPNCWLIPGLSALNNYPELLKKIVPDQNSFEDGKVRINLWNFGKWEENIIDDRIPIKNHDEHYGAKSSEAQVFWPPLLEKAFAKYCKGYTKGLLPQDAMTLLTGGLCETISLSKVTVTDVIENLQKASFQKAILCASTAYDNEEMGIIGGHTYSVIKTFKIAVTNGPYKGSHDFIVLKNPHDPMPHEGSRSNKRFRPPWSKCSFEWNALPDDARLEIDKHLGSKEFCMNINDFKEAFVFLYICHMDKSNMPGGGGLKAYQVGGTLNTPKLSLLRQTKKVVLQPPKLHENPRFMLKIDGKNNELVDVNIGLMADPKRFDYLPEYDVRRDWLKSPQKLATKLLPAKLVEKVKLYRKSNRIKYLGLWIFPIDDNSVLQSDYIKAYMDVVPRLGPEFETTSNQLVGKFKLLPGTYILIPSINANVLDPELNFLIRVFTEHEDVSLTPL